jgi:hypothetical protein
MVEYLSIQHPNTANPDDSVSIANGAVLATVTVTDADSDSATQSVAIGSQLQFQDSGPIMTGASNINIQNSGDVANSGTFAFNLGADGAPTNNDVISIGASSATVNGVAVTNYVLTPGVEDATTASYTFSFDYDAGTGGTVHETGTLTFNKAAGTYTIDLDNPISGISILSTGTADAGDFVSYQVPSGGSGAPEVTVAALDTDFFVQFSGVAEPGSGTGANNLFTTQGSANDFNPVTTNNFGNLELFTQAMSTVQISNTAAGVAGNTIQGGEVLDFNLYATDPGGTLGGVPTTSSTSMFIQLDGIGGSEDMIVVLKLYDTSTGQYTTQAIMVQNADIITSNATLAGTPYAGIVLDNNDGLVVIEANDYQNGNTNLVIVGAQIAGSDEGIIGTATNLNGAIGDSGGSSGTQAFSTDVSDAPFKITSIGFLTTTTTDQDAHLTFDVTVTDGDGDSITQTITADITAAADSSTPISLSSGVTTVAAAPLTTKSTATASDAYPTTHQSTEQTTTNSNAVLMGAFAAAGLAASHSVAAQTIHGDLSSSVSSLATAAYHTQDLAPISLDAAGSSHGIDAMPALNFARPMGLGEAATIHSAPEQFAAHGLMGSAVDMPQQPAAAFLAGTAMPAHGGGALAAMAPVVAMPAAHQLVALGNGSVSGAQHNQVVSQVLADALHGGGGAPAIEHALASLPGHGGMGSGLALDVLASHNAAGVPFGDSSAFAGFSAAHSAISMEAMMVHVDAVQPHA